MCGIHNFMLCLEGVEWSLMSSLLGRGVLNLGSVMRWCTYGAQERECCRELCQCFPCGERSEERVADALPCWVRVLGTSAFNCWEASKHYSKCKLFLRCPDLVHGITFPWCFLVDFWSIIVWCVCSPSHFCHPSVVTWFPRRGWWLNLGFLCSSSDFWDLGIFVHLLGATYLVWATVKFNSLGRRALLNVAF